MMKQNILLLASTIAILSACSKDDNGVQDTAPSSLNLIAVPDMATGVEISPTLLWESAKEPNGPDVAYDLFLGKSADAPPLYNGALQDTSFQITERLDLFTSYSWKVVAKAVDGGILESAIQQFSTRTLNAPKEPLTDNTGFDPRRGHSTTVFDDKLWVVAGTSAGGGANAWRSDAWYSNDGIDWNEATADAGFPKRNENAAVAFQGKLWVIGGRINGGNANDVWNSSDGVNWTQATAAAEFSPRFSHTATVFDSKIWVIGGRSDEGFNDDVWYSADGINWIEAITPAPFESGSTHATTVYQGKLWLVSGAFEDDPITVSNKIWNTSDGINWVEVSASSNFPKKSGGNLLVFYDKLWIVGGRDLGSGRTGDAWFSEDGIFWNKVLDDIPLLKRNGFTLTSFKEKMWLIGGQESAVYFDGVWVLD